MRRINILIIQYLKKNFLESWPCFMYITMFAFMVTFVAPDTAYYLNKYEFQVPIYSFFFHSLKLMFCMILSLYVLSLLHTRLSRMVICCCIIGGVYVGIVNFFLPMPTGLLDGVQRSLGWKSYLIFFGVLSLLSVIYFWRKNILKMLYFI